MSKEIERKFLVVNQSYKSIATSCDHIVQGYLSRNVDATVRVRLRNDKSFLTVKGRNHGIERDEWEYAIPLDDARCMLQRLVGGPVIDKQRYIVPYSGKVWEVDEFSSPDAGLVVAEVELTSVDEEFDIPPFIGEEVTGDPRYYNSMLGVKK